MEVKHLQTLLQKREHTMTKTFITNLAVGLCGFLLIAGFTSLASAQETTEEPEAATSMETIPLESEESETDATETTRGPNTREPRTATSTPLKEQQLERQAERAERIETVQTNIEQRRAALSDRARDRVTALADNISQKMSAAVTRMNQIITRFEARVAIFEQNGVDTAATSAKLNEAKNLLATAQDNINNQTNNLVDAAVASENPRENWAAAKAKFQETKTLLREAHTAIKDALQLLKSAAASQREEASSPAETPITE